MKYNMQRLADKIKVLHNSIEVTRLSKGYSPDEKYVVTDNAGKHYLLRISDIERYDRKKSENFEALKPIWYKTNVRAFVDLK